MNRKKTEITTGTAGTLMEHWLALRRVILISVCALAGAFFLVYMLAVDRLMIWIVQPIQQRGIEIIYSALSEALVILWEAWSFIKPALYEGEKRKAKGLFMIAVLLFLAGVSFCYFAIYTLAIDFFLIQGENLATPMLSIDKYVSFMFGFIVPFGIAFLLPVALYLTTKAGLTDYRMLAGKRKYVLLGIFVLAAILTPPDVVSQVALGVPLYLLYEISIQVARLTTHNHHSRLIEG